MSAGTQQVPMPWTPAPPQLVMAYSVCKGITRTAARNFYYAFMVLPRRKREALCAVYAFMRRCDDITDDASISLPERREKLDTWLDGLHRAQQGEPTDDPILLALTDAQRRFTIPAGLLDELATGTAMDVEQSESSAQASNTPGLTVQYQTFEDLRLYCYRVASVVGLVCIHVFGYRDPAAEDLAERLGQAVFDKARKHEAIARIAVERLQAVAQRPEFRARIWLLEFAQKLLDHRQRVGDAERHRRVGGKRADAGVPSRLTAQRAGAGQRGAGRIEARFGGLDDVVECLERLGAGRPAAIDDVDQFLKAEQPIRQSKAVGS